MPRYWSDSDGWIECDVLWDGRDLSALREWLCGPDVHDVYGQRVGYMARESTGFEVPKKPRARDNRYRHVPCPKCGKRMNKASLQCQRCRHQAFLEARQGTPGRCACGNPKGARANHCADCRQTHKQDAGRKGKAA